MSTTGSSIALAHDYITQRGGAERVALSLTRAFPGVPLHTTLYEPVASFPEFAAVDVRPMNINAWWPLRHHFRLALPFLAGQVSRHPVEADVLITSSSGWAHGIPTTGRKIVYCHAPARWLYQTDLYAGAWHAGIWHGGARSRAIGAAIGLLGHGLRGWDQRAARSADRYVVNSTVIQRAVREVYGIEAEVVPPPPAAFVRAAAARPVAGVEDPFLLCVARLLPYKNVDVVIEAVAQLPGVQLVVVGEGPDRARLEVLVRRVGGTVLAGQIADEELRWLYENCIGLVAASYEDFGLSPLEAASFGKPTAALHDGGYLDTVVEGCTGVFFDTPTVAEIAAAAAQMVYCRWDAGSIEDHAERFSERRFIARMRAIVAEELRR